MTINITIPRLALPDGVAGPMRSLLPFVAPVALAIAEACGAGILLQVGLDIGFRFALHALQV